MSKHTKGNGTEDTTAVFVITPDNIGKTIHFDQKTNKYEVKLSGVAGNLLSLREDGLYYGSKAKPELESLYVDAANGVDQNPEEVKGAGTKANPLKTLAYALKLGQVGTDRSIYLKEKQIHVVDGPNVDVELGHVYVRPYGDRFDELLRTSPSDTDAIINLVNEGNGPIVEFRGKRLIRTSATNKTDYFSLQKLFVKGNLLFDGISIRQHLNVDFTPQSDATGGAIVEYHRILVGEGGSFYFTRGNIDGVSSPTYSRFINESSVKTGGLYDLGLCYTFGGNVTIYNLSNATMTNPPSFMLYTKKGWSSLPTTSASVSTADTSEIRTIVADRMAERIVQEHGGAKWVIAPQVNFPQSFFKF